MDRWGHTLFKEAYSWIPQSSVADKLNRDGVLFIYRNQQWFKEVELLNQVHDSILFQIPINVGLERHADILTRIKDSLESPITWRTKSFSIPVDLEMGVNLKTTSAVDLSKDSMKDAIEEIFKGIEGDKKWQEN